MAATAALMPGTARMVPMLTTGFDGGNSTTSAAPIASSTPGRGRGLRRADRDDLRRGRLRVQAHPPLLEVNHVALGRPARRGFRPGRRTSAAAARPGCHRSHSTRVTADSGCPAAEQLAAQDVGGEIPVTEREPVRARAVGGQLVPDAEGLLGPPPALLLVDAAAQRVHDGVQVRADPQAEQRDVVAGVPDDGDLGVRGGLLQAAEEARGADAAREHGDAHTQKCVRSRPVPARVGRRPDRRG